MSKLSANLKPSSVSEAIKILAEKQLINYEPYGIITLTDEGENLAQGVLNRHKIIFNFFENVLAVQSDMAEKDASKIEHEMSDEVLKKFVMFLEFMQSCSCKEPKWMKSFKHYSGSGVFSDKCQKCMILKKENPEEFNNNHCCGMVKDK